MTNIVMLIGPGRYRLTRQALESLLAHTIPSTYTLTLVLDDADFRTKSFCLRVLEDLPSATLVDAYNSGHTLSQLKNLGVAWSEQRWGRGDWLYLSDSDVWFSEGWLDKLITLGATSENRMESTQNAPEGFCLWGGQVHPFHQSVCDSFVHTKFNAILREHEVLDGPSWLMRWSTWDQFGPLDRTTAPGVCQSEEYPFCNRLLAGGGRIGVIHPHVVIHTGLTHLDGHDCVGRAEREKLIPEGVLAL